VRPAAVNVLRLLRELAGLYSRHPAAAGRQVRVAPLSVEAVFETDARLLGRVLGNLVKNALEAAGVGATVTLGCDQGPDGLLFSVHNPECMPPEVQLQIFNRSFTTKGAGRGLGTYSVKLLAEKCLRGRVHFTSLPEQGTTFFVLLPARLE
jgi:signal transduction histidine kinase